MIDFEKLFEQNKEHSLHGRYITLESISPLLNKFSVNTKVQIIGKSVCGEPIYCCTLGKGKIKILLWSQMHGNEGTTTKALFDFLNVLQTDTLLSKELLSTFTFCCIAMLNPDGAKLHTRENENEVDLNRDAQNLTQPESKLLRATFDSFKPDFCYNLHDQRTIYGVGDTNKSATVSFLAPAFNHERDINTSRLKAINLIAGINTVLQQYIPGQVGRFDDSFNINCVGDTFQSLGVPTVLFEAGHFQNDYLREETRKYIFIGLIASFKILYENDVVINKINDYLNIPQNKVSFYDLLYKNIKINYDGNKIITNFAAQYKEELIEGQLCLNAYFIQVSDLENYFGHIEYDGQGATYTDLYDNFPKIDQKAFFYLDNHIEFKNGLLKN